MSNELAEELVSDYLQARGLADIDHEFRAATSSHIRVEQIVSELLDCVDRLDLPALRKRWGYYNERVLNNITEEQNEAATEYESDMYKLYLARCVMKNDKDRCTTFFAEMKALTVANPMWAEWFYLPYATDASEMDAYKKYFTRQWRELFTLSLSNFFNLVLGMKTVPVLSQLLEKRDTSRTPSSPPVAVTEPEGLSEDILPTMGCPDDELFDEFAVIAQCAGPMRTSSSKQSLKSLIKNISKKDDRPK